jgi:hypothetical protein
LQQVFADRFTELGGEITDYVLHNGPYAVLYQPAALFGVRNTVTGFEWNPMGFTDFWKIVKIA